MGDDDREVVSAFASYWDEHDRRDRDESATYCDSHDGSLANDRIAKVTNLSQDQWGSTIGSQAAAINALIAESPKPAKSVSDVLLPTFSSISEGRVRKHFSWLEQVHPTLFTKEKVHGLFHYGLKQNAAS